ncbi:hypothetical protein PR001_g28876, partial [Phytophthora rubi]
MHSTSAVTTPPASVQLPSGDTSGEGDTAGTDGQGGQAASSPAPVDSRNTPSPGRNSAGDDDAGDGHSTAGSPRFDALRGSHSDSAVNSRQTCVIGSTNSVGTQTADTLVTRFLTEPKVRRLETDNSLPAPELGPRGDVVAPTRCDFSMDPSSLGRTRLVGVPASNDHLLRHIHARDGYAGLEALVQVEELDHADLLDFQEFFPEEGPPVADLVLRSRTEVTPGEELMSALQSLPVQREVAALLSEYGADNLAERTFATVSLLRRILDRYCRVCRQPSASASRSRQDALKAQDQLRLIKLSHEFARARLEVECKDIVEANSHTAERYRDDVKALIQEQDANTRRLREENSKLQQQLDDSLALQRVQDQQRPETRFEVADLMNFLGDHATLACNWTRLRDLLAHFHDHTPVPGTWQTVIATTAGDDPLSQSGLFTSMDRPDDRPNDTSQQEESPEAASTPLSKETPFQQQSRRPSSSGDPGRYSKQSSHRVPPKLQLRPVTKVRDTASCRPDERPQVWSAEKARVSLPVPVTWKDIRLDIQHLMLTGIYFQGALDWLGEDRPVHTCFYRDDLVEMLVQMMFWNKLNDSYWPKYVPERYYLAAETRLDDLVDQGIQPPFWGELVPSAVLDAKVLLEESESECNDASEESAWSDTGKESSEDDAVDTKVSISAENSCHRRKRSSSPVSVPDQPPAKRSRRGARRDDRSPLAQKEYSELTADEKTVVEVPGDGVTSWRCHGVRVKHSDPSSTKESQTPGFPAYTPNRHDLDLLKARFNPDE